MKSTQIIPHLVGNWHKGVPCFCGTIFDGMKMLLPKETQEIISNLKGESAILNFLKGANGFFSIINIDDNTGWMAVDRIRSMPIFYGQHNGKLFISDDARWVREQVQDHEIDPIARKEFLACGYVTGPDTLFPNVKQVQAGEVIFFEMKEDGNINLDNHRYFRHNHDNFFDDDDNVIHREYDNVLNVSFQRLITFANNRPLLVPLSGGYDSRLIVMMLKRLQYDNVIAFTYGRPGNRESQVSREVAKKLGIRWEFVPYTDELWGLWNNSDEMKLYFSFADGLSSLPHIQNWAVKCLKEENRIPENVVVVPGHSAGSIAGEKSESCPHIYTKSTTEKELVSAIIKFHYSLYKWSKNEETLEALFEQRVRSALGEIQQYYDNSSAFESWDMSERQTKFIVNSVRLYEFFGFDWWLPFWDREYVSFWRHIKSDMRIGKCFHISHVNMLAKQLGLDIGGNASDRPMLKNMFLDKLKKILPRQYLPKEFFLNYMNKHPFAIYGRYPKKETISLLRKGYSSNGIAAYFFIKKLEENLHKGEI